MVVYITINNVNGKIYIGQDNNNNPNYLGSGLLLQKAILKYGVENFSKHILEFCDSKEELNECEKKWINKLNSQNKKIGYNISDGGTGGYNYGHLSEKELLEVKRKISEGVKLAIKEGRKKVVPFTHETAKKANKIAYENCKKDNFKKCKEKERETKTKNGTLSSSENMKEKNRIGQAKAHENDPTLRERQTKHFKGTAKLDFFIKKYGEELGLEKYKKHIEKIAELGKREKIISEEQKEKISNTLKERYKTIQHHRKGVTLEETVGKERAEQIKSEISKRFKGKKISEETKEKRKKTLLEKYPDGIKRSEETKKALSEKMKGKNKGVKRKKEDIEKWMNTKKENRLNEVKFVILECVKTQVKIRFQNKLLLFDYFTKNIFNSKNTMNRINRMLKKEIETYKGFKVYYEIEK